MITVDGMTIRAIQKDDIDVVYKWNTPSQRGEFQEFEFESIDSLSKQLQNGELFSKHFQMLMIEQPVNSPVGLISLSFVRVGMVRIGIVLCPQARKSGVGRAVTQAITDYLFSNYPIVRIEADTDADNIAAQTVLESTGFLREGVLRKYRFHHGRYRDFILYSKINESCTI